MDINLTVHSEALDDIPLLVGIIKQMGICEHIDAVIKPHGNWQGASVGKVISLWLCYLLNMGDHRLVAVRDWVAARETLFNESLGIELRATDCSDDRLATILSMLGEVDVQEQLDEAMLKDWISIYPLPRDTIRLDSTTVTVHHQREEQTASLIEFGFNREAREGMRQFKVMLATLDPLGLPITASVEGGSCADDVLYIPSFKKAVHLLGTSEVLVVGDSKMSYLATRAQIVQGGSCYLCPLNENSLSGEERLHWVDEALQQPQAWQAIYRPNTTGQSSELLAVMVERERELHWIPPQSQGLSWKERVLVIRSVQHQQHLIEQLERRWQRARTQLEKLQQPAGHGRKLYRSEESLRHVVEALLQKTGFAEIVEVEFFQQPLPRGKSRWAVSRFSRDEELWKAHCERLGWRVYATNTMAAQFDASALVWIYRHQVLHERTFSRLKTRRLNIQPVFLRDEQRIGGLTWLLMLALRILTLTEFRLRQALLDSDTTLIGLNPAVPSQAVPSPTADRALAVFQNIYLTIIYAAGQTVRYVTTLNATQRKILTLLALPTDLYAHLALSPP